MNGESKDGLLALMGFLLVCYSLGTVFVTWVRPSSAYQPLFRARWGMGASAAGTGAAAIVASQLTAGATLLLLAFHSKLALVPGLLFLPCAGFAFFMRMSDWLGKDEA